MSHRPVRPLVSLAAAAAVLVPAAGVGTASAAPVSASRTLATPHVSPVRIPGTAVRRGHRLHGHEVLVYRRLAVHRRTVHFTLRCPKHRTLRGIGFTGHVAPNIIGSVHYVGHRSIRLRGDATTHHKTSTAHGTTYALCR